MMISNPRTLDHKAARNVLTLLSVTLILLFAFVVGLRGSNADVIWSDELYSLTFMGAFDPPFGQEQIFAPLHRVPTDDVPYLHHVTSNLQVYYVIGAIWAQFVGWSQFAMRYLSLMAGIVMIACLYGFAADTVNRGTGLVAAFLMATNAYVMIYFHELRGYTLLLLFIIIHSWLYWRLISRDRQSGSVWMLFVLSASALLYTHVISLVMLVALGVIHILFERRSSRTRSVLLGWAVGLAMYSPYLRIVLSGSFAWGETETAVLATQLAGPLLALLTNGLSVTVLPLSIFLAVSLRRNRNGAIHRLLLLVTTLFVFLTILSGMYGLFAVGRMRYFLLLWFPCIILMAYSLTAFNWSLKTILVFLAIWVVAGVSIVQSGQLREYTTYVGRTSKYPPLHIYRANLRGKVNSRDYLVGFAKSLEVNKIRDRHIWSVSDYYLDAQLGIDGEFLHANLKRYRLEQDVQAILKAHPQILLAHDPVKVPLNYARTLATIQEELSSCDVLVDEPKLLIHRYVHPVMGCNHEAAPIEYDNGVRVVDRAVQFDVDAERIKVLTWWDVPNEAMLEEYNISLQVFSAEGQNVRQVDRHLYDNIVPWNVVELSTADLPADDYALVLILYRRDSGSKVIGVDKSNDEKRSILPIATFDSQSDSAN